jgi:SAM-dependent methyltransferase
MNCLCPCCGSTTTPSDRLRDDRYGEPGWFPLLLCSACGHHHLGGTAPRIDPKRLYAERYPRATMRAIDWRPSSLKGGLTGWLAGERSGAWPWVPHHVRLLDIGCGTGQNLAWHRTRGCRALGIDPDPAAIAIAASHGLDVRCGTWIDSAQIAAPFDCITCDQVLEHLPDPIAGLRDMAQALKPGGRLIIATPNGRSLIRRWLGRRWVHWHAPYHLHIFSPRSLRLAVTLAGLRPIARGWTTPGDWPLYQFRHLCEPSPRPGSPSGAWAPLASHRGSGWLAGGIAARIHQRLPVLALMQRALDAARRGDNQLLIAERPA